MLETIIGMLTGGIFRIIPEVLKFLDLKNERKHELDMQDKAIEFKKLKGDQQIDEIKTKGQAEWNTGALDVLKSAIAGQSVKTGVKWVDALSALVRPLVTFWYVTLYSLVKLSLLTCAIVAAWQASAGALWLQTITALANAVQSVWTPDDNAIYAGILNFWFLGRVFDKVKQ